MSAVLDIVAPVVPVPSLIPETSVDMNARRWLWSAALTEQIHQYLSGHEVIERRTLLPLDTHETIIPPETPARVLIEGQEQDVASPFGSQLSTYTERAAPGTQLPIGVRPKVYSIIRKTAAGLAHDITFGMNAPEERGIGEIVAFRGQFNTLPGPSQLSSLYAILLPVEHRKTLKKTIAWLESEKCAAACEDIPILKAALPEFQNLANLAMFYLVAKLEAAESEIEAAKLNPKGGKESLKGPEREWLRDTERTERSLIAVQQNIAGQERIAQAVVEGLRGQTGTSELDELRAMVRAQGERLEAFETYQAQNANPANAETETAADDAAIEAKGAE